MINLRDILKPKSNEEIINSINEKFESYKTIPFHLKDWGINLQRVKIYDYILKEVNINPNNAYLIPSNSDVFSEITKYSNKNYVLNNMPVNVINLKQSPFYKCNIYKNFYAKLISKDNLSAIIISPENFKKILSYSLKR